MRNETTSKLFIRRYGIKKEWEDKKDSFKVVDVRKLTGNFLPKLLNKAQDIALGQCMCVVQSFEPVPLYSAMADIDFEHVTEKISDYQKIFFNGKWGDRSKRYFIEKALEVKL